MFTPGPWFVENLAIVSDEGAHIANVIDDCDPDGNGFCGPDAKLIAAAPDLLAALQHVYAVATQIWGNNPHDSCLHEAAAAIEKATK